MPRANARTFRLGVEHDAKLDQIAASKEWTDTQVLRKALDVYHKVTFGRRAADMVPITTTGKRGAAR